MDVVEIQSIYYMVAATGVLVAAVFYILNLRISQKNQELSLKAQQQTLETRQAQLFIQICNQTLNNPAFMKGYYVIIEADWKNFDEYLAFLGKPGSKNWNDVFLVGGILESIGVLVEQGLVDISLVASLMARVVVEYGEKVVPMLHMRSQQWQHTREKRGKKLVEMHSGAQWKAEYLYHRLVKYLEEHPSSPPGGEGFIIAQ